MHQPPPLKSGLPGVIWPALPGPHASMLLALQHQLEKSQWLSQEALAEAQWRQLSAVFKHAYDTVPFYRMRFGAHGIDANLKVGDDTWEQLPILTRADLVAHSAEVLSRDIPRTHGGVNRHTTSGSTGEPLEIMGTGLTNLIWLAVTLRDHTWHQRDVRARLFAIRSGRTARDPLAIHDQPQWGRATGMLYDSGPSTLIFHRMPLARIAELLLERNPDYLLAYPSMVLALAQHFAEHGLSLANLRDISTYGEPVPAELAGSCRERFGVPVSDKYSAEEVGYMALQCPEEGQYHVQAEAVHLELIDDAGKRCRAGEVGRVIVTTLHNYAVPLIRYDIGDFARAGETCGCGRGLPVLKRILGRKRNRITRPDGRHVWPDLPSRSWRELGPIRQIQVVQRTLDKLEVTAAMDRALRASEEQALRRVLHEHLGYPFELSFAHRREIARHPNGKYETFISDIEASET